MTSDLVVMLTISRMEAVHLADLASQFADLIEGADVSGDPAIGRLVPDAYPEDARAARDFRRVTEGELLARRAADAARVRADLAEAGSADVTEAHADDPVDVALDDEGVRAWMRTLTAIRLVIASRLGIETEADHDEDDPRFGVYDWLGYRLEGLIRAVDDVA